MGGLTGEIGALRQRIADWQGPPVTFMEVCGTHTMAIARIGLKALLPPSVRLVSGPGCPVCVTPVGYVDHALALAERPEVILTTFGDLMRVPGSAAPGRPPRNLLRVKALGGDVRVVYSPTGALDVARDHPEREVVFLGVGFETTAPVVAATLLAARRMSLANFSVLGAHKTIPEAMAALASSDELGLDGFLCPGHVSVVLGEAPYRFLADELGLACAIGGFEAVEVLRALVALLDQVESGSPTVDNCYPAAVRPDGNPRARAAIYEVFEPEDCRWRGLGVIPGSGLGHRPEFAAWDASQRFDVELPDPVEPRGCRCGDVLRGLVDPADCPLFGRACTPESPVGACMVSSEGSCAARFHYTRRGEG